MLAAFAEELLEEESIMVAGLSTRTPILGVFGLVAVTVA